MPKEIDWRADVVRNKTDIDWIKSHMKTQTGLLLSILLSILGAMYQIKEDEIVEFFAETNIIFFQPLFNYLA